MRFFLSLLAVIGSGAAYGWCFPPLRIKLLAWIVLVPLFVVIRLNSLPRVALLGMVFAVAATCATVDWLPSAVATYYGQPAVVGWGLFAAVTLLMVVPHLAAFAVCCKLLGSRYCLLFPVLAGAAWVMAEFDRSRLLTGNPWVLLGYSQVGVDPVVEIADLAGVYGVSFVIATVNAALAECCLARLVDRRALRRVAQYLAISATVLVLALAYGHLRIAAIARWQQPSAPIRVAIIQGNLDLGSQWRAEFYGENLATYLRLTIEELRKSEAPLVVWPENAMSFFLESEPLYQEAIGHALTPFRAQLIAGGPYVRSSAPAEFYNSAFVISPAGRVVARYDKEHLLPFGEYFPFPHLDFLRRSFRRVREFTPGSPGAALPTVAGPAGVLICNELLFPEIARARVAAGASYLLNLSNDTWINSRKFSAIAFDIGVLRAVEERRYLVRASTSGPSAIVDHLGRVVTQSGQFTREVLAGLVRPNTTRTVYSRVGDVFAVGCVGVVVLALALCLVGVGDRRRAAASPVRHAEKHSVSAERWCIR